MKLGLLPKPHHPIRNNTSKKPPKSQSPTQKGAKPSLNIPSRPQLQQTKRPGSRFQWPRPTSRPGLRPCGRGRACSRSVSRHTSTPFAHRPTPPPATREGPPTPSMCARAGCRPSRLDREKGCPAFLSLALAPPRTNVDDHVPSIRSIGWNPFGSLIATGAADKTLRVCECFFF